MQQCIFIGDLALAIELVKRLIEGLHTRLGGTRHERLELMYFALANQIRCQRRIQQHFNSRSAPLAVRSRNQLLGNNSLEVKR